jgi:hypothetical protein
MKIAIAVIVLVTAAATSHGQGTVKFDMNVPGSVVAHAYITYSLPIQIGNGPGDYPAGTTDWTGWTPLTGDRYSAQLWAGMNPSSLQPCFPIRSFGTGAQAGFVVPVTATLTGVPVDAPWLQSR